MPLLLFAFAVQRLRLTTIGMLQYLAPSIAFILAVTAFGEPINATEGRAVLHTAPWEAVARSLRYRAGAPFEPAAEFVHASPYVPAVDALHGWAAESFAPAG